MSQQRHCGVSGLYQSTTYAKVSKSGSLRDGLVPVPATMPYHYSPAGTISVVDSGIVSVLAAHQQGRPSTATTRGQTRRRRGTPR